MKHKHYDCIVAWANGAEIESRQTNGTWLPTYFPQWRPETEYRIAKPKKRTETKWLWASKYGYVSLGFFSRNPSDIYTIKLEWSATEFEVEE